MYGALLSYRYDTAGRKEVAHELVARYYTHTVAHYWDSYSRGQTGEQFVLLDFITHFVDYTNYEFYH